MRRYRCYQLIINFWFAAAVAIGILFVIQLFATSRHIYEQHIMMSTSFEQQQEVDYTDIERKHTINKKATDAVGHLASCKLLY